jgi:hypothetical protein
MAAPCNCPRDEQGDVFTDDFLLALLASLLVEEGSLSYLMYSAMASPCNCPLDEQGDVFTGDFLLAPLASLLAEEGSLSYFEALKPRILRSLEGSS